jgi:hypothetical protein
MKNVFRMLGALAIAVSLTGCFIDFGDTLSASQTNKVGVDAKTVKVYYKITGSSGSSYTVGSNSITNESLDSVTLVSNNVSSPRAVVVIPGNTLTKCAALVSGEGCFQIVTNSISATSISGKISFKFSGTPLTLNYSADFLKPIPTSLSAPVVEGVDDTIFILHFTAKDGANAAYPINKAGITEETLVNVVQSATVVASPRAVGINSVVTCDPIPANVGEGCFKITIGNRVSGTKTVTGSVGFKLDGTALSLPFTHTFPNPAP